MLRMHRRFHPLRILAVGETKGGVQMKLKVTQKELTVWNFRRKKAFGISANENCNKRDGLPDKAIRDALAKIQNSIYGIIPENLTLKQIRDAIGEDPIFCGEELKHVRFSLMK